jgi:tetratricopeptide (TPR) repeat protein
MASLKRYHLFVLLIALVCSNGVYAQDDTAGRHISPANSIKLQRFLDSVGTASVYSQKRQHYLDSALAIMPWNAYLWQQKAMPLFKMKKYEIGMVYLDSAVKYDRRKYIDYRAFIKCIFQKDYSGAMEDFRQARAIFGNTGVMDHSYGFYTGLCYLQLNRFDSARYYISQSINSKITETGEKWVNPLEWFYLGIISYEEEKYADAIASFDKSLALYAECADVKYYKAMSLDRSGKPKEALAMMREAAYDMKQAYSINEDNAIYEAYPYQVNSFFMEHTLKWFEEKNSTGKAAK